MRFAVAIVDFGNPEYLTKCVASLNGSGVSDSQIFIHNGNEENLGFTVGNNKLIKNILGLEDVHGEGPFEWVWLLNNDTHVPKETVNYIKTAVQSISKTVGILGFQIRSMDEPDLIHHAGTVQCYPNGIHKSGSVKLRHHSEKTFEKWVTAASILVRREVFQDIGLLDQNMHHICTDADFCYRARATGWKVMYDPKLVIYHKIGTSAKPNPLILKTMNSDTLYFQNKWLSGKLFIDLDRELL